MTYAQRFARLPTAAKLLLILTAVLLPVGLGLTLVGQTGIRQAKLALDAQSQEQSRNAGRAVESLIARNALAIRLAANSALAEGTAGACDRARRTLAIAPAVAQSFELETIAGQPLCSAGEVANTGDLPVVAPGDIQTRVAPGSDAVAVRTGVNGGMATALIGVDEIRTAVRQSGAAAQSMVIHDRIRALDVVAPPPGQSYDLAISEWPIGDGSLETRVGVAKARISLTEQIMLLLPVLMWILAALIAWLLLNRLLIRPLKRLERAVRGYQPGDDGLDLPQNLGPSAEIQELRDAFGRALSRADESEREMSVALDGQRRLVREVHHRVKNNLQVVASLLNIHGRNAETTAARAAYAGISRRVGALSIVHRNHYAEMEESRGVSLRPLISELAAELRASAPELARAVSIDLDVDTVYTTQDVAVAVAFLVTEMVEFAMLNCPQDSIEVSIRRTSELTARLTISSPVLVPEDGDIPEKVQFERIVSGLAKQLRSTLDRKLGRYSVDLPAFPPA
ncbi:MAG: sensor histidine kinase [Sphingomicrobium sp.]